MSIGVNSMNNMATKSAMVGFVPNQKLKEARKEEEHTTTIHELEQQDTSNSSTRADPNDPRARAAGQGRGNNAAQQNQQRRISLDTPKQPTTTEETGKSTGTQKSGQGAVDDPGASSQGAGKPRILLDNTARINWQFQTTQKQGTNGANNNNPQSPDVQKRQFLTRLRSMVNTEYQQYVKSDSNPYTRRDLRSIMQALGSQEDPNVSKTHRDADRTARESNDAPPGELEGFNKFNQMRAARTLTFLAQYQEEPPQDQLSLVA